MKVGEIEIDPCAMTLRCAAIPFPPQPQNFACSTISPVIRDASSAATTCSTPSGVIPPTSPPRSVDVYVRRIREKIEPDPENPRYLKTVRGRIPFGPK